MAEFYTLAIDARTSCFAPYRHYCSVIGTLLTMKHLLAVFTNDVVVNRSVCVIHLDTRRRSRIGVQCLRFPKSKIKCRVNAPKTLRRTYENPPHIVDSKLVSIGFEVSPDKNSYTLTIPDILEEKGVMKRDWAGNPLHVVPAMDLWGNKITYLDNVVFKYHEKGVGEWDLSGHQANVKEFHMTKEMYANKKLLMQHGDMSGTWTAEQKKMIEDMGMKPE